MFPNSGGDSGAEDGAQWTQGPTHAPPRALLIDLDGVLRLWSPDDGELERAHALPAGSLRAAAFEPGLLLDAIEGRMADEAWRQRVIQNLSEAYPSAQASSAVEHWSRSSGYLNQPVLELVEQARRKLRVVLVTNATSRLNLDLAVLGLAGHLDAVINSSDIGSAKPKKEIFMAALAAAGVAPAQALFLDDQAVHVDAAASLGIPAIRFTNAVDLLKVFQAAGILDATS